MFFPFFGSDGGDFFFISLIFLSIPISWLLANPDLRLDGDKRVASHGLRYRCGIFFFFSRPTPSRLFSSVCLLELSPARGRGRCRRAVDLRLRAWRRSACLLSYRAALSLTLVRYSGMVRPAGCVAWLSCRFHAIIACREFPLHLIRLKRFNRCGFLSNHPSVACGDAISFNPIWPILSLLARSAISLVVLFLACGRMMRCRVLRSACLVG